jgi:hypothetical protein
VLAYCVLKCRCFPLAKVEGLLHPWGYPSERVAAIGAMLQSSHAEQGLYVKAMACLGKGIERKAGTERRIRS